jgi:hypothetical protein
MCHSLCMTPTRRLLDMNLDGSLDSFVHDRRIAGKSWQTIARELSTVTNIDITDESLRRWYGVTA